jgi:magnesium transporter
MSIKNILDSYILEDIQNPEHPSDFTIVKDHSMLVLRLPEITNNTISIFSYAFIIQENICYLYDREKHDFVKLGSLEAMNHFLDTKTEKLIKEIKLYYLDIDTMEDSLYENSSDQNFMSKWLTYKKELSLIHRLIFDATLSFELFIKYHKKYTTFEELAYADLYEHMERIRDLSKAALDKLDHLYDFYRAKVDEKMNRNIYYLTLLSGIFLPLTLVSGFFGMNTGGLPFTNDADGTIKVVVISLILEVIIFLPFFFANKKKKIQRFKR